MEPLRFLCRQTVVLEAAAMQETFECKSPVCVYRRSKDSSDLIV